jgi:hypothetical protein
MTDPQPTRYEDMAVELTDLRTKISPLTAQVLAGLNMATGKERTQIVRDVLHEWASNQVHTARMVERLTRGEGFSGASMPSEDLQ